MTTQKNGFLRNPFFVSAVQHRRQCRRIARQSGPGCGKCGRKRSGIGILRDEGFQFFEISDLELHLGRCCGCAVPSHEELGRGMAGAGADAVFWLGGHGDAVYRGLMEAGFTGRFTELAAHDIFLPEFSVWEKEHPGGGRPGTVLFKGSRGNHLEKLVKAFEEAHAL